MPSAQFRFDAALHEYFDLDTGDVLPHVTGMLAQTGWIDDRWYTEEDSERGTAVHDLTAEYDLGVLEVAACQSPYRGWLLGHVELVRIIRPTFIKVEVPMVHPTFRYGTRTDRTGLVYNLKAVVEVKTGAPDRSHQIQTALQAIVEAADLGLPVTAVARFVFYLKSNGHADLIEHVNRADFDEAYRIIRECCR